MLLVDMFDSDTCELTSSTVKFCGASCASQNGTPELAITVE
ncbi:hypothetical protein BH11MYX1_BH11MYX1_01030 [soil metagenome]